MAAVSPSVVDTPAEWDAGVLKALYELVFSQTDREVAGVLVGVPAAGSENGLPFVRAAIPTTEGFMPGQASLFVHETWAQVHATMARYYSGLETVGWYVSRPAHGTSPTEADVLNHGRWFSRRDQILMIVDSATHRAAMYVWDNGRLVQLTEGPIARRYSRPPRLRFPAAGVSVLALMGIVIGVIAFIIAQALGG